MENEVSESLKLIGGKDGLAFQDALNLSHFTKVKGESNAVSLFSSFKNPDGTHTSAFPQSEPKAENQDLAVARATATSAPRPYTCDFTLEEVLAGKARITRMTGESAGVYRARLQKRLNALLLLCAQLQEEVDAKAAEVKNALDQLRECEVKRLRLELRVANICTILQQRRAATSSQYHTSDDCPSVHPLVEDPYESRRRLQPSQNMDIHFQERTRKDHNNHDSDSRFSVSAAFPERHQVNHSMDNGDKPFDIAELQDTAKKNLVGEGGSTARKNWIISPMRMDSDSHYTEVDSKPNASSDVRSGARDMIKVAVNLLKAEYGEKSDDEGQNEFESKEKDGCEVLVEDEGSSSDEIQSHHVDDSINTLIDSTLCRVDPLKSESILPAETVADVDNQGDSRPIDSKDGGPTKPALPPAISRCSTPELYTRDGHLIRKPSNSIADSGADTKPTKQKKDRGRKKKGILFGKNGRFKSVEEISVRLNQVADSAVVKEFGADLLGSNKIEVKMKRQEAVISELLSMLLKDCDVDSSGSSSVGSSESDDGEAVGYDDLVFLLREQQQELEEIRSISEKNRIKEEPKCDNDVMYGFYHGVQHASPISHHSTPEHTPHRSQSVSPTRSASKWIGGGTNTSHHVQGKDNKYNYPATNSEAVEASRHAHCAICSRINSRSPSPISRRSSDPTAIQMARSNSKSVRPHSQGHSHHHSHDHSVIDGQQQSRKVVRSKSAAGALPSSGPPPTGIRSYKHSASLSPTRRREDSIVSVDSSPWKDVSDIASHLVEKSKDVLKLSEERRGRSRSHSRSPERHSHERRRSSSRHRSKSRDHDDDDQSSVFNISGSSNDDVRYERQRSPHADGSRTTRGRRKSSPVTERDGSYFMKTDHLLTRGRDTDNKKFKYRYTSNSRGQSLNAEDLQSVQLGASFGSSGGDIKPASPVGRRSSPKRKHEYGIHERELVEEIHASSIISSRGMVGRVESVKELEGHLKKCKTKIKELSSTSQVELTGRLDVTIMNIRDMPETKKVAPGADCYMEATIDFSNGDGTFYDYPESRQRTLTRWDERYPDWRDEPKSLMFPLTRSGDVPSGSVLSIILWNASKTGADEVIALSLLPLKLLLDQKKHSFWLKLHAPHESASKKYARARPRVPENCAVRVDARMIYSKLEYWQSKAVDIENKIEFQKSNYSMQSNASASGPVRKKRAVSPSKQPISSRKDSNVKVQSVARANSGTAAGQKQPPKGSPARGRPTRNALPNGPANSPSQTSGTPTNTEKDVESKTMETKECTEEELELSVSEVEKQAKQRRETPNLSIFHGAGVKVPQQSVRERNRAKSSSKKTAFGSGVV
mmetsp:Transcript_170/g.300  ORF Transcript_170/g.300 Transcript_170/m.300 type:complete len:1337 (+) Transcript_170:2-4012(+)